MTSLHILTLFIFIVMGAVAAASLQETLSAFYIAVRAEYLRRRSPRRAHTPTTVRAALSHE